MVITLAIFIGKNYCVLSEYHKCVVPHLTWIVSPTMNLISGTHHLCEKREYAFMILQEYLINFSLLDESLFIIYHSLFKGIITFLVIQLLN